MGRAISRDSDMLRSQTFRGAAVCLILALLVALVAHLLRHPQAELELPAKAPELVLNLPGRIQAGVPFAGTAKVTGGRLRRPACSRPDIQFRSDGVIAWAQPLAGMYEITFTVAGSGEPMTANWQVTVFEPPPKKERPKVVRLAALQRPPPPEEQTEPHRQPPPPRREPPPPTEPAPRPPPVAVEPAPQPAAPVDAARRAAYARHQAALAAAKAAREAAAKRAEEAQARALAKAEEARLRKAALEKAAQTEKNAMRQAELRRQAEQDRAQMGRINADLNLYARKHEV